MIDFSKFNSLLAMTMYFNSEEKCKKAIIETRWGAGRRQDVVCSYCGEHYCPKRKDGRFRCNHCKSNFSCKVGTIFEDTNLPLVKTALETVYFWPDLKQSFSEVYRVLKPGGMFMFSYGLESNATMRYWTDQIDAMTILPIDEISKILADTGFDNLQTATKGDYTINIRIQKPEASN